MVWVYLVLTSILGMEKLDSRVLRSCVNLLSLCTEVFSEPTALKTLDSLSLATEGCSVEDPSGRGPERPSHPSGPLTRISSGNPTTNEQGRPHFGEGAQGQMPFGHQP